MLYEYYIVAIGASAGGLKALKDFFSKVTSPEGLNFVVALHSSRNYESQLSAILSRYTTLPIVEIEQGLAIQPGTIYLHPPSMKVSLKDGHFFLTERPAFELVNKTINHLFMSVAADAGKQTIGVIFSGTGDDGTIGFHAIEAAKGITIVQDPKTAEFDGMPLSSIKYDHPTFILPPGEMPVTIQNYVRTNYLMSRLL